MKKQQLLERIEILENEKTEINRKVDYLWGFIHNLANCDTNDFELDFERNGYSVWILKIGNKIRIETIKKDSLIYLYGK